MNVALALFAGLLLAGMVALNGGLAKYIGPVEGSFVIHAIGLVTAALLVVLKLPENKNPKHIISKLSYFGGIFGAIIVVIVGYTVNSPIGVAGTIAMVILGQLLFGFFVDITGFFNLPKRKILAKDLLQTILLLIGSGVLLYA